MATPASSTRCSAHSSDSRPHSRPQLSRTRAPVAGRVDDARSLGDERGLRSGREDMTHNQQPEPHRVMSAQARVCPGEVQTLVRHRARSHGAHTSVELMAAAQRCESVFSAFVAIVIALAVARPMLGNLYWALTIMVSPARAAAWVVDTLDTGWTE